MQKEDTPRKTLTIYYLIDTGAQMAGDKIGSINSAMEYAITVDLPDVSTANEDADIQVAIIQFSDGASWITPGSIPLGDVLWNDLHASGANDFGQALCLLEEDLRNFDPRKNYAPIVLAFSNAPVTGDYMKALKRLEGLDCFRNGHRIGIPIGSDADKRALEAFVGPNGAVIAVNDKHTLKALMRKTNIGANSMVDLKSILKQHPSCLNSRASFKSVLMDKYPSEKRQVNILTILFECGLAQRIKSKPVLEDNDFRAMLLQLENDYGIVPKYSSESIKIWADALGVTVQATSEQASAPVTYEPIIHKPIVDNVVIEGRKSDYETAVLKSGSLRITKFIGFDEREITIPNRLDGKAITVVGENAFAKCTGIEKVVIPEGITTIENGAFSQCKSLKKVLLPTTLKWLGNSPKMSTPTHSWQSPAEIAHDGVFQGTAICSIDIPAGLAFLGKKAFMDCKHLIHIDLPNGVKVIPEKCFFGCCELETIALPDNLSAIHNNAFVNAGLEQIDIPPSCKKIEFGAFERCEHLSQILLHEGLTSIGDWAFANCPVLCAITIPNSVTEIGTNAFCITGWYGHIGGGRATSKESKDLVISCYAGSYGLEYARKEGFQIKNAAK